MKNARHAIAVAPDQGAAERALKVLYAKGFARSDPSMAGRGYRLHKAVTGFYHGGDRVRFWGSRGALWGQLLGDLSGGLVLTVPAAGHVVVQGYLANSLVSMVEGAAVLGGVSGFGLPLRGLGNSKDRLIAHERALEADSFMVMARGPHAAIDRVRSPLRATTPASLDFHGPEELPFPAMGAIGRAM